MIDHTGKEKMEEDEVESGGGLSSVVHTVQETGICLIFQVAAVC